MLWRSRDPSSARPSLLPVRLRFVGYPVPIHDRDITKKHGESADIDQKDFHRSPFPGHRTAISRTASIRKGCDVDPLHIEGPVANCSVHPPEQFAGRRRLTPAKLDPQRKGGEEGVELHNTTRGRALDCAQ